MHQLMPANEPKDPSASLGPASPAMVSGDTNNAPVVPSSPPRAEDALLAPFDADERSLLRALCRHIQLGLYADDNGTLAYHRLIFMRWLYTHDRLTDACAITPACAALAEVVLLDARAETAA